MSSAQVIDSEKAARNIERFFLDIRKEKQANALVEGLAGRQEVVTQSLRPMGKILSHADVVRKLQQLNPSILYERSHNYPDQGGIYVRSEGANPTDLDFNCRNRMFVTGLGYGMIPENSVPTVKSIDEYGQPVYQLKSKGWRDTLKVLIHMRLITLTGAERLFGSGGKGWHLQLHS